MLTVININNKRWDKLRFSDVRKILSGTDDESFFFEFKADDVTPQKLMKEISAFANTYGGYILLGIDDDKNVSGCQKWTEQRIHTTIHDSITPTPIFDIKRFRPEGKNVFVIKIEEGSMPPYITNSGQIYERISSGSFSIKDSSKLSQLYYKREDQLIRIKNKIELEELNTSDPFFPNNICGYLDIGFSMNLSEMPRLKKEFATFNLEPISEYVRTITPDFSISRLGHSFLFCIGNVSATNPKGGKIPLSAGINNFLEVMWDGSVKCRVLLTTADNSMYADITPILYRIQNYLSIYSLLIGEEIIHSFITALRYEKLTVIKQFTPVYKINPNIPGVDSVIFRDYLSSHKKKYGNNLIIESSRVPKNDYDVIDLPVLNLGK